MIEVQREEGSSHAWIESGQDSLGALVDVGDNFAIPALPDNDKGVDFYVRQCQHKREVVVEKFTCPWEEEFEVRQHILVGTYYQK